MTEKSTILATVTTETRASKTMLNVQLSYYSIKQVLSLNLESLSRESSFEPGFLNNTYSEAMLISGASKQISSALGILCFGNYLSRY